MPLPQYPRDNGGVIVTLADIYHAQQEQSVVLAEIKGTLALASQQTRTADATMADHESRIRKVETKVVAIPSVATLIAGAALAWAIFGR